MRRPRLLVLAAALALPAAAGAWTEPTHERVALLAVKLMPPGLRTQLERNQRALLEGVAAPGRGVSPAAHRLHADGSAGDLDAQIEAGVQRAVAGLRARGTFADFARELGAISHLVA